MLWAASKRQWAPRRVAHRPLFLSGRILSTFAPVVKCGLPDCMKICRTRQTSTDILASVELLAGRRASLLEALEQQIPECSHAPVIARLRCFRGIDTLTAAGVAAEVGNFARFPKPALLSGFLGIVPSERTSDLKRRQGAITKAGSGQARPPPAGRSRSPPQPPTDNRRDARAPPGRTGPADHRDRLAHATTSTPTLAPATPRAPQARRCRRDRGRPRAHRIPLGGRHP
jgi:Transposase IS116/IS110/IS902 family